MTNQKVPANPKSLDEIRTLIKQHKLGPDASITESYNRKLLVEGFVNIKNRVEYNKKLEEAGNVSLDINSVAGGWITNLVRDTIGGKINCVDLTVEWVINGKKIIFDPISGSVNYASQS